MILLNISQILKSEKNRVRNFLGLNRGAKSARNTRGVTTNPPLKRISSRDSKQEPEEEMRLHFIDQGLHERLHEKLHDFEY